MSQESLKVLKDIRAVLDCLTMSNRKHVLNCVINILKETTCGTDNYVDPAPPNTISNLQKQAFTTAKEKGWYNKDKSFGDFIALFVNELAEAYNEYANNHEPAEVYFKPGSDKPEGIPIELCDCIIAIMSFSERHGVDLENALLMKMAFNKTRPYLHGGKRE